jgi:hypothetical protein
MFENLVLRGIFGSEVTGGLRKLQNEELIVINLQQIFLG